MRDGFTAIELPEMYDDISTTSRAVASAMGAHFDIQV